MEDELLLDHLILKIKDDRLSERAIEEEWSFQRFLKVASRQPASRRQADEINGGINIKKDPKDDERIKKIKNNNPKKSMQDAQDAQDSNLLGSLRALDIHKDKHFLQYFYLGKYDLYVNE